MKVNPLRFLLAGACAMTMLSSVALGQSSPDLAALSLSAAEAMMLQKNRDIALARRFVEQAQADVIVAGQKPNPQLGWLTQNINRNRGVGAGGLRDKTVDSIVSISQTFERGDKAGLRVATARQLELAAGNDLVDTARNQLLGVRTAYFDLLAAQEKAASTAEAAQLFDKTIAAATTRQKAGDLAGADVARIGVDAVRAQNDARAAQAELARARLALAVLIASEAEAGRISAASAWPEHAPLPGMAAVEESIERRPDVRAAVARVAAADKARELAQSLRIRDVTMSVQFEHYPTNDTNQMGSGNSLGIGVSVPLYLRHYHEGEIARAQADWYAARDFLVRVRAQALADALRARGDLEAAYERRVRTEKELLPKAIKSAEAAEFAFRNGAIGVMDLLDSRRTLKAVQIEASASRADYAKAQAAWQSGSEPAPVLQVMAPNGDGQMERKQ
jgi:cobalt-zinc-cadmium efflux system outer membrane protein